MKAGLTGLAQTKGRNDIGWDKKVEFDNEYIDKFKKHGVLFDIKLLFDSIIKVFKEEDIYENKVVCAEDEIIRIVHLPDE